MPNKDLTAAKIAQFLLKIKAVKLSPEEPFTWASGWKSPIYCDNRKTLSFPEIRTFIRNSFKEAIEGQYGKPDCIAGVATGGIALGALVADAMNLPFIYIRSGSKGHGLGNRIEGVVEEGQSVVVIEDLISTGGSSLSAVEALRDKGVHVSGLVAIFSYGFQQAEDNFQKANCPYTTLSHYDALIAQAVEQNYVQQSAVNTLKQWRKDPAVWSPVAQ